MRDGKNEKIDIMFEIPKSLNMSIAQLRRLVGLDCINSMIIGEPSNLVYIARISVKSIPKLEFGLGIKCLNKDSFVEKIKVAIKRKCDSMKGKQSAQQEQWYAQLQVLAQRLEELPETEVKLITITPGELETIEEWGKYVKLSHAILYEALRFPNNNNLRAAQSASVTFVA